MITLGTMMLPAQVTLIPQFVLFYKLGWINTFLPLWVPHWFGGGAFAIFLMRQFFLTLPKDLDEAALIDGAGYFRIFWSILMPLCKPILATLAIITLIASWSDFLGPLIYLNTPDQVHGLGRLAVLQRGARSRRGIDAELTDGSLCYVNRPDYCYFLCRPTISSCRALSCLGLKAEIIVKAVPK